MEKNKLCAFTFFKWLNVLNYFANISLIFIGFCFFQIIAKVSVDNRTRALTQALRRSSTRRVCINRVEELTYHLLEFPDSRGVAIKVISDFKEA